MKNELYHHGIKGQKWGIRRYQNPDGSLTPRGMLKYYGRTYNSGTRSWDNRLNNRGRKFNKEQTKDYDDYYGKVSTSAWTNKDVRKKRDVYEQGMAKFERWVKDRPYSYGHNADYDAALKDYRKTKQGAKLEKATSDLRRSVEKVAQEDARYNKNYQQLNDFVNNYSYRKIDTVSPKTFNYGKEAVDRILLNYDWEYWEVGAEAVEARLKNK